MSMQGFLRLSHPAARRLVSRHSSLSTIFGAQTSSRSFQASAAALANDELPYHIVMGLPALSPTMDAGALAEWYVSEGDSFIAGDVLAKIETDKATIDFEAQDDGHVAKLLREAGDGADIPVGEPILISVEEAEHVGAFKDYVVPKEVAKPEPVVKATPEPVVAAPPPPPVAPAVEAAAPPPPPPAAVAAPPTPAVAAASPAAGISTAYGLDFTKTSPLAKTLAASQKDYMEKYGTTGQRPLL